jgi:hypothetical protein
MWIEVLPYQTYTAVTLDLLAGRLPAVKAEPLKRRKATTSTTKTATSTFLKNTKAIASLAWLTANIHRARSPKWARIRICFGLPSGIHSNELARTTAAVPRPRDLANGRCGRFVSASDIPEFKPTDYQCVIAKSVVHGGVPDLGNRYVRRREDYIITARRPAVAEWPKGQE